MNTNINRVNLNWEWISVADTYPATNMKVEDVVMTIPRDPSNRNRDNSYEIERAFLDLANQDEFIHLIYETQIPMLANPIYVEFGSNEIRVGLDVRKRYD